MAGFLNIPYNPRSDPWQYLAGGAQNMMTGLVEQEQRKHQIGDIQDVATWVNDGMQGTPPDLRTDFGQNLAAEVVMRQGMRKLTEPADIKQQQLQNRMLKANIKLAKERTKLMSKGMGSGTGFGVVPWYLRPEFKDTPEGLRAREKSSSKPLTVTSLAGYNKLMDTHIDAAYGGMDAFDPNYKQNDLLSQWEKFKTAVAWQDMPENHRRQLWENWNRTITTRGKKTAKGLGGNEYQWDPEADEVKAAGPEGGFPRRLEVPSLERRSSSSAADFDDDEIAGYVSQLDPESRAQLQRIYEEGDPEKIRRAIEIMRSRFGGGG